MHIHISTHPSTHPCIHIPLIYSFIHLPTIHPSIYLTTIHICILPPSLHLSAHHQHIHLFIHLPIYLPIYPLIDPPTCSSPCVFVHANMHSSTYPPCTYSITLNTSICLPHPSFYPLSTYKPIYLFTHLSIHQPIHPFISSHTHPPIEGAILGHLPCLEPLLTYFCYQRIHETVYFIMNRNELSCSSGDWESQDGNASTWQGPSCYAIS